MLSHAEPSLGKDLGKVWSRQKGVKRSNRQKAEERRRRRRNEKEGIRTRQGFGELKNLVTIGLEQERC